MKEKSVVGYVIGLAIFILGFFMFNPFFVVGAGQVGVTFNRINGNTRSYSQGMHFKIPFVQYAVKFDVKTRRLDILAEGASKDLQVVKIETVLNYHLKYDAVNELYVKVGKDYIEKVIEPAVNESVKYSISQYPVEQIIVEREKVKSSIEESLTKKLSEYNIILESLNLVDIDFTDEFNKVVEQKQIEEQKIKTAEYQRRQAEEYKKKTILEAEAEAQKQQLLKQTTSKEVIELKWIERWDGELPQIISGKDNILMISPNNKE